MTGTHVPVLAGELVDLTRPGPGETAVDCTFGAGGHARLLADCDSRIVDRETVVDQVVRVGRVHLRDEGGAHSVHRRNAEPAHKPVVRGFCHRGDH